MVRLKDVPDGTEVQLVYVPADVDLEVGDTVLVGETTPEGRAVMDLESEQVYSMPDSTQVNILNEARMPAGGPEDYSLGMWNRLGAYERVRQGLAEKPLGERFRAFGRGTKEFLEDVGIKGRRAVHVAGQIGEATTEEIDVLAGEAYGIGEKAVRFGRRFAGQISGNERSIGAAEVGSRVRALETDPESGLLEGDTGIVIPGPRGRTRAIRFEDSGETIEPRQNLQVRVLARPALARTSRRPDYVSSLTERGSLYTRRKALSGLGTSAQLPAFEGGLESYANLGGQRVRIRRVPDARRTRGYRFDSYDPIRNRWTQLSSLHEDLLMQGGYGGEDELDDATQELIRPEPVDSVTQEECDRRVAEAARLGRATRPIRSRRAATSRFAPSPTSPEYIPESTEPVEPAQPTGGIETGEIKVDDIKIGM